MGIVPEKSRHLAGLGSIQVSTEIDILIVCWHSYQPSFGADRQVAEMRWVARLQLEKPEESHRFINSCRSFLPGSSDWILMYM